MQEIYTMALSSFSMLFSHSIEFGTTEHASHFCTTLPEWVEPTDLLCSPPYDRPVAISWSPCSRSQQIKKTCAMSSTIHTLLTMAGVNKIFRKGGWVVLCVLPIWGNIISAYFPGLPFQTWCFEWDLSHSALDIYIYITLHIQWREIGMSGVWVIWFTL